MMYRGELWYRLAHRSGETKFADDLWNLAKDYRGAELDRRVADLVGRYARTVNLSWLLQWYADNTNRLEYVDEARTANEGSVVGMLYAGRVLALAELARFLLQTVGIELGWRPYGEAV